MVKKSTAAPTTMPAIAPAGRPVDGVALGSVSKYLRAKTMFVMTVSRETVGVVPGTRVTDGIVTHGVSNPRFVE